MMTRIAVLEDVARQVDGTFWGVSRQVDGTGVSPGR